MVKKQRKRVKIEREPQRAEEKLSKSAKTNESTVTEINSPNIRVEVSRDWERFKTGYEDYNYYITNYYEDCIILSELNWSHHVYVLCFGEWDKSTTIQLLPWDQLVSLTFI